MKNISKFLSVAILAFSASAHADTFVTVPHPQAVFDSTLGSLYSICPPGQASACTVVPNAASATTWTGVQTFSNSGIRLLDSSTGYTTFTSDNSTATNYTLHFPAANDTLVTLAATQTLTNKTLMSPTITGGSISGAAVTGPTPNACGATCTLTAANASQTTLLNAASGSVATLPAATGSGNKYPFVISVTVTSNKNAVLAASSSDFIQGIAIGENAGTAKVFTSDASTNHSLQMPFAGTQPDGGFIGDSINCQDIATHVWQCNMTYQAGTTPTSPFSTATN